jgi:hypothetical protein
MAVRLLETNPQLTLNAILPPTPQATNGAGVRQ